MKINFNFAVAIAVLGFAASIYIKYPMKKIDELMEAVWKSRLQKLRSTKVYFWGSNKYKAMNGIKRWILTVTMVFTLVTFGYFCTIFINNVTNPKEKSVPSAAKELIDSYRITQDIKKEIIDNMCNGRLTSYQADKLLEEVNDKTLTDKQLHEIMSNISK